MIREVDINELFSIATYYYKSMSINIELINSNHIRVTLLDDCGQETFEANVYEGEIFELLLERYEKNLFQSIT